MTRFKDIKEGQIFVYDHVVWAKVPGRVGKDVGLAVRMSENAHFHDEAEVDPYAYVEAEIKARI